MSFAPFLRRFTRHYSRGLLTLTLLAASSRALDAAPAPSRSASSRTLGGPTFEAPSIPRMGAGNRFSPRLIDFTGDAPSEAPGNNGSKTASIPANIDGLDLGSVKRVKIMGQALNDAPMRVGNLDILAPIVSQLSRLGAMASRVAPENIPGNINTPSQDQMFQINLPSGPPIVMVSGRAVAYIKNVEQPLRAAPLVMRDKIWLPLYSIAPLLGAAARLEPDGTLNLNPTVQSVELFPVRNTVAISVKTSAPLAAGGVLMGTLDDPPKLYLDFPGYAMGLDAANSMDERTVSGALGDVSKVRVGMFEKFPGTTRVVLDLKKPLSGVSQAESDRTIFTMVLVPPGTKKSMVPRTPQFDPAMAVGGNLRGLTIVIDAGHGGHDTGARGANSDEKNHNLDIARRLKAQLISRGANVLMTRESDVFITLTGRSDFANTHHADIFFSIHINASRSKSSSGTATYFWTGQSAALAREVQTELARATGLPNRGVHQERFSVIRKTWAPSILTETAFISNAREEALLMKPEFREKVARGMAQGIANYAQHYLGGAAVSQ